MKRVLIIGKDSYIGESIKNWLDGFSDKYKTTIVSSFDYEWKQADFKQADVVINTAGIAHVKKMNKKMRNLFYSVNRDLSFEIADWAKKQNVKHFILFSSMNVYGDYCGTVKKRDVEHPTSFYGDSKLQGDHLIHDLESSSFVVSYLRPPFVYGKGCRGNYSSISKIAKKVSFFPKFKNKKSMIYIDNLCEFVRLVIDNQFGGILTPQNKELVSTTELVSAISACYNKKVHFTILFNWAIYLARKVIKPFKRAFSDDCYSREISNYWDFNYCIVGFKESIQKTEN